MAASMKHHHPIAACAHTSCAGVSGARSTERRAPRATRRINRGRLGARVRSARTHTLQPPQYSFPSGRRSPSRACALQFPTTQRRARGTTQHKRSPTVLLLSSVPSLLLCDGPSSPHYLNTFTPEPCPKSRSSIGIPYHFTGDCRPSLQSVSRNRSCIEFRGGARTRKREEPMEPPRTGREFQ